MPPEQQPREASLDVEVTQIQRGLHDHLPETRDIIDLVNSARRNAGIWGTTGRGNGRERCEEAPVCKIPPVEGARGGRQTVPEQQPRKASLVWR